MARPSKSQMDLLKGMIDAGDDQDAVNRIAYETDWRTQQACISATWIVFSSETGWHVTEAGRAVAEAGITSNATDKVNVRVPDELREQVDAKNRRIGTTTTAVIIDAMRRYVAEPDERSALRLEARTAPEIRAQREAAKAGK